LQPHLLIKEITMKRSLAAVTSAILCVALAGPAFGHEAGQWILRAGVGTVMPKDNNLSLPDLGVNVDVDDGTSLTLTGTYMFSDNWAFDILAAYPFKHDVNLVAADGSATIPFGEVEHLPPTFSVQYHFLPDSAFQPFVGLGVNYTTFLSEDLDAGITGLIADYSLDDSFGVAAQVGADWMLGEHWLVNFDVRWINIESDLKASFAAAPSESATLGTVAIDPWVLAINVGYSF
jgi:outer membrane protein